MIEQRTDKTSGVHFDVLIVGAGLSGIGAAAHLLKECSGKTFAILEARTDLGGTWDLFRYPGVRSDSDMYTLGYNFKPWTGRKAIADGASIKAYIAETARERGIDRHILYGHRVIRASWSSDDALWTLQVERESDKAQLTFTASFLAMCSGYYSYAEGYRPRWPGEERFKGTLVHPQFWPEGLDYKGKTVVVVGSGATAVTLVPEMAKDAAHVTMLQRSPTYMASRPTVDAIAEGLKKCLPKGFAVSLVRWKNVLLQRFFFRLARRKPRKAKARLIDMVRAELPNYDVETHFTPRYDPWDQRLCLVTDGDLFNGIRNGRISVVTDTIDGFTETGIRLSSGKSLDADIVVTATGLKLNVLGDVAFSIDGAPIEWDKTLNYRGCMFSDVPNLISVFGYTNASWTLKADLVLSYMCRLVNELERRAMTVATPVRDPTVMEEPFLDFSSGYVQRALAMLPKQGSRRPWKLYQDYVRDLLSLRFGSLHDGTLEFSRPRAANAQPKSSATSALGTPLEAA